MVATAYIGFGSNTGEPIKNCLRALGLIDSSRFGPVKTKSGFYKTEPVGEKDQEWFVNGVCSLEVTCTARELLNGLLSIEQYMGRVRKEKWGPRIIDLDILLFGDEIIEEEGLVIPHPLMHRRRFVLMPLSELAPDGFHPVLKKRFSELLAELDQSGQAVIGLGV